MWEMFTLGLVGGCCLTLLVNNLIRAVRYSRYVRLSIDNEFDGAIEELRKKMIDAERKDREERNRK